jgi:crossover junction endodeoxyribonuclease RuvC
MRVLGFDPGTTKENPSAVALVSWPAGGEPRLIGTAQMAPRPGDTLSAFLGTIGPRLRLDWLNRVDLVGVEWPYFGKNAQSALDLAACCGTAMTAAGERGIPCVQVSPSEAKKALTRKSDAEKKDMIEAVRVQFQMRVPKDQADAVGIALAAVVSYRTQQLGGTVWR